MAAMTLEEAQAMLTTVNAAISDIIQGKRLTQLQVGSGAFRRTYTNQECSLDSLRELQKELLQYIDSLEPVTPTFRNNATIPLIISKDRF